MYTELHGTLWKGRSTPEEKRHNTLSEHLQTNLIGLFENLHITYTYFWHEGGGGH